MMYFENPGCHGRRFSGSPFWSEWPLPFPAGSLTGGYVPPVDGVGVYVKKRIRKRCDRVVILEGAIHDGTTYTSLGTEIVLGRKVRTTGTPSAFVEERPYYWDNGAASDRLYPRDGFVIEDGFEQYKRNGDGTWLRGVGGALVVEEVKDVVLLPASKTFSIPAGSLFKAMVGGVPMYSAGGTLSAVSGTSLTFACSAPASIGGGGGWYDSDGVQNWADGDWGTVFCRLSGDDTVYTAAVTFNAGADTVVVTIASPALQSTPVVGVTTLTILRRAAIPANVPHDLLLLCTTYKLETLTRTIAEEEGYPEELGPYTWRTEELVSGILPPWYVLQNDPEPDAPDGNLGVANTGEDVTTNGPHSWFDTEANLQSYTTEYTDHWKTYWMPGPSVTTDERVKSVENAGTLIRPSSYYSRCEPRVYYATP